MPVAATAVWRFDMSDTAAGRTRQRLHLLRMLPLKGLHLLGVLTL
jgi:hypothetical protein